MRTRSCVDRGAMWMLLASCTVLAVTWTDWRADLGAQSVLALGYEPPPPLEDCVCSRPAPALGGGSEISLSEGNLTDAHHVARVTSAFGPTLELSLHYNSANADGSKMQLDTGLGAGWTHSYNSFLFRQPQQPANLFRLDAMGRVTTFTPNTDGSFSPNGGYFERLTPNTDGSFTVREKNGTRRVFMAVPRTALPSPFDTALRLASVQDRNGNTTTLTYTGGHLTAITDTFGRTIALGYVAGKIQTITDPAGRVTRLAYDPSGSTLQTITDPSGRFATYTYNPQRQIVRKLDRDGRTFSYEYDGGKPVGIKDDNGVHVFRLENPVDWAIDRDALENDLSREYLPARTSETDGRGHVWRHIYDRQGYVTSVEAPDGAGTTWEYDPATYQPTATADANGHATLYAYDALGNLARVTNALGHQTTYQYETNFSQVTRMDVPNGSPGGGVTTYAYDTAGNRTQETDPLGAVRTWTYDGHGNVLTETDRRGNTTRHEYDGDGNRVQTIDPLGRATVFVYDGVGNLVQKTDAHRHVTFYDYDALDRRIAETDPLGHVTRTAYDGEGNRLEVLDPYGHRTAFAYDERKRLVTSTDALGQETRHAYDKNNNRTALTDAKGNTTSYEYDLQNRLIAITDALGHRSTRRYDDVGNLLAETDANEHTTTYAYDKLNRRTRREDAVHAVTTFEYDTGGGCAECLGPTRGSSLVTKQTDANGKVTYIKYDPLDRIVREVRKEGDTNDVIDASDAVTGFLYDADGNQLSVTLPNGNRTTYEYDSLNRRTRETNAAGDLTTNAYDSVGNLVRVNAPNRNVTRFVYDAADRLVEVQDREGLVSRTSYDPDGQRTSEADGNGHVTTFAYDELHRLVRQLDAKGQETRFEYDEVGNQTATVDREGQRTRHEYDKAYRRIQTLEEGATDRPPLSRLTRFAYDDVGNLIGIVDANEHATTYEYDDVNRRTAETYPDQTPNTRTFEYDPVGNMIRRVDQKGRVTTYMYNDLYFLTGRDYGSDPDDVFSYDLSGRMLTADRGGWPVRFAYDGADRLVETVQNGRRVGYVHEIVGRLRHVEYPGGRQLTERMDLRGRKTRIDGPRQLATFEYDQGDRVLMRRNRNGVDTSYAYDENDWLTTIDHRRGRSSLVAFDYAHDREGNKQFERKLHDTTDSEAYAYDGVHRLVDYKVGTLVGSTVPIPATQTAYDLDLLGNWNTKTTDGVPESRTHNEANEIASIDAVAVVHDDNGNLTNDGRLAYEYDDENRLVRVSRIAPPQLLGEYQYDALGRRVRKVDHLNGRETLYFYDSWRVVEEQASTGTTSATYVYGNYLDEVLTMDRGGETYYYHQNALYSVHGLSNSRGALVEGYRYDAYGRQTVFTPGANGVVDFGGDDMVFVGGVSSVGNPYSFAGQRLDEDTGLHYYRARHYDSLKGRFLQRDMLGYVDGMNLYGYVGNRPTFATDPSGHAASLELTKPTEMGDQSVSYGFYATPTGFPANAEIVQFAKLTKVTKPCKGQSTSHEPTTAIDYGKTDKNGALGRDTQGLIGGGAKWCCYQVKADLQWWVVKGDDNIPKGANEIGRVTVNGKVTTATRNARSTSTENFKLPAGSATTVGARLFKYEYIYVFKNPECRGDTVEYLVITINGESKVTYSKGGKEQKPGPTDMTECGK